MFYAKKALCAAGLCAAFLNPAYAATEIQWWYSMTNVLSARVPDLADQFNKSQSAYRIVATQFLSQPEVQAKWHQDTHCLPTAKVACEFTSKSGFYQNNPGIDIAVQQMIAKTIDKSRGIRFGNFVQVRGIVDEELENVWPGKKTAEEAPDVAVERGDGQLARFEKANR